MVLFALTRQGLAELLGSSRSREVAIWVNHGLLATSDLDGLRADGVELTNFTRWIDPNDQAAIELAVQTIREHHPDQAVFVEQT